MTPAETNAGSLSACVWALLVVALCVATGGLAQDATLGAPEASRSQPELAFEDVAARSGIAMTLTSGSQANRYVPETMSGGVALIDYDNDGWLDIYFVDGSTLEIEQKGGRRNGNRLYRNNRNGTFRDVTASSKVGGHRWGMGVCAGDIDNNGLVDLYVTNLGPNILYLNSGDGTFRDISVSSGTAHDSWSTSCAFGDYDRDGRLDLYVAGYLEFDVRNPPKEINGERCDRNPSGYCGPVGLTPAADRLFRNVGNNRFVDVSAPSGIHRVEPSYGLGVVWFDSDGDGDLDLYVANDLMANFLFRNDGNGTFTELGVPSGTAFSFDGRPQAGMGVDAADYDDDGDFDIFVTNFANDYNTLYRNDGSNRFSDGSTPAGLAAPSLPYVGWGTQFVDLDLDGRQDLVVANGHAYMVGAVKMQPVQSAGYKQRNLLFWNRGNNRFLDAGRQLPGVAGFSEPNLGRGLAAGDLNNDGLVDLVITSLHERPRVLLNRSPRRGHWLAIHLVGASSNRSAIGAVVSVRAGGQRRQRLIKSGGSYQSHSDLRAFFGLGAAATADEVTVAWPGGRATRLTNVALDRVLTLNEP